MLNSALTIWHIYGEILEKGALKCHFEVRTRAPDLRPHLPQVSPTVPEEGPAAEVPEGRGAIAGPPPAPGRSPGPGRTPGAEPSAEQRSSREEEDGSSQKSAVPETRTVLSPEQVASRDAAESGSATP